MVTPMCFPGWVDAETNEDIYDIVQNGLNNPQTYKLLQN